ncbi:MAG: HlyD family type I secretion periplasmic adaptor subunit [Phreatobacter sp.]|jgi:adhesin transport system membrane fusion protein|nr:HlyD family type I secretion periplasmic adaptor subunit [Phreatobacter sp.]
MSPKAAAIDRVPREVIAPSRPIDSKVARYLTPVLQIEERSPPILARLTVFAAAFAVLGFFTWAAVAPLREIAIGRGEILPEGFVQPIQHLEGGRVARLFASEGQRVRSGDPIIALDDAALRSELEHTRARRLALEGSIGRLQDFAEGRVLSLPELGPRGGISDQRASLDAQVETRAAQLRAALAEIESRRQALGAAKIKKEKLSEELGDVRASITRREPMLRAGLVRLPEIEALHRDRVRLESEFARTSNELASAESAVDQATARHAEIVARARQDAYLEILKLRVDLSEATSTELRLEERLQRLVIRSPVDGLVNQLSARSLGAVIAPGGPVAEIVPYRTAAFAEVEVSPDDVGHIRPGMPVLVKVSAFDFARFGGIPGIVESVSPTSLKRPNAPPVFRIRIRLEAEHVGPAGLNMTVQPGMVVNADIRTGQKTLLAYLLKPVHAAFSSALSER